MKGMRDSWRLHAACMANQLELKLELEIMVGVSITHRHTHTHTYKYTHTLPHTHTVEVFVRPVFGLSCCSNVLFAMNAVRILRRNPQRDP